MFSKRIRLKLFLGGIVVTAAIAVVGAPLGNAARSHKAACQENPGHWVSVTHDLGVPTLELVGATVCTDAVTGLACTASQSTQPSAYSGWVQVTDDTGVPWLYPAGSAQTLSTDCVQKNVTASVAAGSTEPASPQSSPPSPYPGWVVVSDDQGVPWLQPVSP